MSADLRTRKRILLALTGPARPPLSTADFAALDGKDWAAIDAMAAQHRLRPWLHHRRRSTANEAWPVPDDVAARWQDAYRDAAFGALIAQATLVRLAAAFAKAEVPMVALKGARLAFFDYPEAALRPMRDLDILVAEQDLPRALDAMAAAGCAVPSEPAVAIARALDGDKHLDPILLPDCDRHIELHHRIAEPGLPCIETNAILRDAAPAELGGGKISYPSPEHMLGHLVLHAAYNHRLDCGPLALIDIAMLCAREQIDAARFRAMAEEGAWLAGARLVLALTARQMGAVPLDIGQDAVPEAILKESEALILQDFESRAQVKLATEGANDGLAATVLSRLKKGLSRPEGGNRLHWILSRALRTVRQGSDSRARAEASSGAAVARWLGRTAP